jgi:hypothetical protein
MRNSNHNVAELEGGRGVKKGANASRTLTVICRTVILSRFSDAPTRKIQNPCKGESAPRYIAASSLPQLSK